MKPEIIDNVNWDEFVDEKSSSEIIAEEPYKFIHHFLMTFWSTNDCDVLKNKVYSIIESCHILFEDDFAKFIKTDKGTLSVIDIPVNWLFEIDKNVLSYNHASLIVFYKLLYKLSHTAVSPLNISYIIKKKKNKNDVCENYLILYQERIYKENINEDKCHILFDKLNSFIKEHEWISFISICDEIKRCYGEYENKYIEGKEFLTITNLSSSKDIPQTAKDLMTELIKAGRAQFLTQYDCLLPYHEEDPLPIHIYLKKPEDMPEYNDLWKEIKDDDKDKYIPQGKVLGYYTREDNGIKDPHIVLCPENIEESSGPISVDNLYALVLVHEMSHAILDKYYEYKLYNSIYENWNIEEIKVWQKLPNSLYSKAMEESLANMMALMWIMSYNNLPLFDQSIKFISNQQPAIYQFGISQYLANVDWKKWRNSPKNMKSLEEWFRTFFKDGNIIIQNDTVLPAFNAVFTAKEE